jgi:hypothetical protein
MLPKTTALQAGWMNVLIGVWLIISPFALGFSHYGAGLANNVAVGIALIALTFASTRNDLLKGLIVFLGTWLGDSAFVLAIPNSTYLWNNLILAFLVIAFDVGSSLI